jgi:sigma-54 specific flagellar transcriptional regulator A
MTIEEKNDTVRMTSRGPLVAGHATMRNVLSIIDRVAGSRCTVLVTGESGTGKELAVAALHDASPRRDAPLVTVNCGAIPENLVESELFGHARGAFTGATTTRQGVVAAAEGGTLFLDEVGELSLAVQVKLLRLLQQREYTPVGESRVVKCDVRIVAATNRDLAREVAEGRFREDLYYRLNVIHVQLPALRERRSDIPLLARHFLGAAIERTGRGDVEGFSEEAIASLVGEKWAGNIRSLENTIERAVLLARGTIVGAEDLVVRGPHEETPAAPPPIEASLAGVASEEIAILESTGAIDLRAAVEEYENNLILGALQRAGNNKSRAAQMLGLHRTTFVEMLKRKRIESTTTITGPMLRAA